MGSFGIILNIIDRLFGSNLDWVDDPWPVCDCLPESAVSRCQCLKQPCTAGDPLVAITGMQPEAAAAHSFVDCRTHFHSFMLWDCRTHLKRTGRAENNNILGTYFYDADLSLYNIIFSTIARCFTLARITARWLMYHYHWWPQGRTLWLQWLARFHTRQKLWLQWLARFQKLDFMKCIPNTKMFGNSSRKWHRKFVQEMT